MLATGYLEPNPLVSEGHNNFTIIYHTSKDYLHRT